LGGDGRDRVDYEGALVVTLDGVDDDGGPGENDHLEGIEDVRGSGSPDGPDQSIVGDDLENSLTMAGGEHGLVDGRGGDDRIGFARNLLGGDGDDAIELSPITGARAEGGNGADRITGQELGRSCHDGGCVDVFHAYDVDAGPGDDTIRVAMTEYADAVPDAIVCGDGWDVVEADHEDVVALDCEVVERR
ncbi:MAG TPA: hypothetical protein VF587_09870, partial [Solirubrobacteraceae bacterium]